MNKVFLYIMAILPNPPYCISTTVFRIINLLFSTLEPQLSTTMAGRCSIDNTTQQVNEKDIWSFPTDSNSTLTFSCSVELPFSSISTTWLCLSVPHRNCSQPKNFTVHSVHALKDVQILQNCHRNYFHLNTQEFCSCMVRNYFITIVHVSYGF